MPAYVRPSLSTLIQRAIGDITARSRGSAFIRRSMERVLAYVHAGGMHGVHGHLDWLYKQMSPVTCDLPMLLVWGLILRVPRLGATKTKGSATFAGTNGKTLPTGTALQAEDGTAFTVTVGATVSGGEVTVAVEADVAGTAGNRSAATVLSLVVPLSGIDTDGAVAAPGLSGGLDIEDVEDYRGRILDELQVPASGGGIGDYEKWALRAVDTSGTRIGATRAWEFGARPRAGEVTLAFVCDARETIIPTADDLEDMHAYIAALAPLDLAALHVVAPTPKPVDMTILLTPEDGAELAATRAAVLESLALVFAGSDLETSFDKSDIHEAISQAVGEDAHEIVAISDLTAGELELITLGTVTWA
jgi:uncharacterized phage protein gp47/JayE